jgi:hypothetical protein
MKQHLACTTFAVALVLTACEPTTTAPPLRPSFDMGGGQGMNLDPGAFGERSLGAWRSHEGLPDAKGNADFALYLQKLTATSTVAAAFAGITGVGGLPTSELHLSWSHRDDGWCGAGAPRWNVGVAGLSGNQYTIFLGCAHAVRSGTAPAGWTSDAFSPFVIAGQLTSLLGFSAADSADIMSGTVTSLAIIFDEGTDVGPGVVFLDNITVNAKTWTAPQDNGT